MKLTICVFLAVFALAVFYEPASALPGRVRRQTWNWGDDEGNSGPQVPSRPSRPTRPTRQTTQTAPTPGPNVNVDTSSPAYKDCIARCVTTPEYNPVCADNRVTYDNVGKFNCARTCGLNILKSFNGQCSALR